MSASLKPYVMPVPPMGLVHWYSAPGGDPSPAIVTGIGRNGIALAIVPPDSRALIPKDGVMHVSDPRVRTAAPESGFWDFTPQCKAIRELLAKTK